MPASPDFPSREHCSRPTNKVRGWEEGERQGEVCETSLRFLIVAFT